MPADKVTRITDSIHKFVCNRHNTKQAILRLLGHLSFASSVVPAGRPFRAGLIELSTKVKDLFHVISITPDVEHDLNMWEDLLKDFNGVRIIPEGHYTTNIELQIFTDASSSYGFAVYNMSNQEYFYDQWVNHPIPCLRQILIMPLDGIVPDCCVCY